MTRIFFFYSLIASCFFLSCNNSSDITAENSEVQQQLDSLFEQHQYFEVRRMLQKKELKLAEKEELLLKAKLHSVFNERKESNKFIDQLLNSFSEELTEEERIELLETQINNSVFLFDYSKALEATKKVLSSDSLPEESRKEHQNTLIIYETLQQVPPQEVHLEKTELPIVKDIAGLSRIPVDLNSIQQQVVFDTGANFSVITDSLALRSGIEVIGEPFNVKAITGGEVKSRIGIADSLRLGNTILKNVVFLVFPEESLSFPEANYTIDAILGFPVINALEEIMLINGEEFVITGDISRPGPPNLALDFLTPIVEVYEDSTSLPFTFDTGANSTALYRHYFELRKEKVLEKGSPDSLRFGGAGGVIKAPVYYIPFSGQIGESHFQLDSAAVHIEDVRDYPGIYGNLGQDVLSQFDTLVLDFKEMAFIVQ